MGSRIEHANERAENRQNLHLKLFPIETVWLNWSSVKVGLERDISVWR